MPRGFATAPLNANEIAMDHAVSGRPITRRELREFDDMVDREADEFLRFGQTGKGERFELISTWEHREAGLIQAMRMSGKSVRWGGGRGTPPPLRREVGLTLAALDALNAEADKDAFVKPPSRAKLMAGR
jgi:hypothetical protein